ncbi:Short-chain dehydrogenase/reductase SDR, partial [Macrophomina phaseolina MS6]
MAESLRGKNIAVTGAASGMGLAIAKRLAAIGANVSLADVQECALATAVSECESAARAAGHASTKFFSRATDVRDTASVNAWIAETVAAFGGGPLHGAANFAGVVGRELNSTRLDDIDDADWDFVVAVNMTGVMKCMRAQVRAMGEGVGGSIVNASSIMGVVGSGYREAYCA